MEILNEKAKSKSQQRLFGMVYHYKGLSKEEQKEYLDSLPSSLANKIKSIADGKRREKGDKRKFTSGISKSDAEDFASTKHKGLPEKIEENIITKFDSFINENLQEDKDTLIIETRKGSGEKLKKIIDCIKNCGNVGHTFTIIIDDQEFEWDGDGSDYIFNVKLK
jgi:hypothetical protein